MAHTNPSEQIATVIRGELGRRRMSARALAQHNGWNQRYLSRRLCGAQPFTINDLDAIARTLELPITALLPAPIADEDDEDEHKRAGAA